MADSKYGRIYAEKDVLAMLSEMVRAGVRLEGADPAELLELNVLDPTLPAGEPVFVLRARDEIAPHAITSYLVDARYAGCSREFWASVADAEIGFVAWQRQNPSLVRKPD